MALNPQNLKRPTSEQARKNGRKGGLASAKAKKERKTVQKLLNTYLDSQCKDNPAFDKMVASLGLKGEDSIKMLMVAACAFNTIRKGNLDDLTKLCEILGESAGRDYGTDREDDPLTKALKEEAERMDKSGEGQ